VASFNVSTGIGPIRKPFLIKHDVLVPDVLEHSIRETETPCSIAVECYPLVGINPMIGEKFPDLVGWFYPARLIIHESSPVQLQRSRNMGDLVFVFDASIDDYCIRVNDC